MPLAYILLVMAICAAWLPSLPIGPLRRVPLWAIIYSAAVVVALSQGTLQISGAIALLMLVVLAGLLGRVKGRLAYWSTFSMLALLCLGLSLHKLPGFNNPIAINAIKLTTDASPFTQYLNFDKGSVGLVLVAFLSMPLQRTDLFRRLAASTLLAYIVACAVVFGASTALGLVRLEPKVPSVTWLFLTTNFFLVCVAEQAFFRFLIQDPLRGFFPGQSRDGYQVRRAHTVFAVALSGVLFGVAHAAGGLLMILMATLAGTVYAVVYAATNRIEAPLFVHFGLNAMHFLAFTYPRLSGPAQ